MTKCPSCGEPTLYRRQPTGPICVRVSPESARQLLIAVVEIDRFGMVNVLLVPGLLPCGGS